jgi:heme-degrading monooxygenase HmoA
VAVLVILTMEGETKRLPACAEEFFRHTEAPPGLLSRTLAGTEDGAVLVSAWSSQEARARFHDSREYCAALEASGVAEAARAQVSESYPVRRFELFPDPRN